jgi:hypothetical protein
MRLVVGALLVAVVGGYLSGGRLRRLAALQLRWVPLVIVGLALQVVNLPGRIPGTRVGWPLAFLLVSFVLLSIFAVVNLQTPGFALILVGTLMNFAVIAVNAGMPVLVSALVASGQGATVADLRDDADLYVKHHLADAEESLLFLGDVIALPPPVAQVVSIGDIFTYTGVILVVAWGMRPAASPARSERESADERRVRGSAPAARGPLT